MFKKFDKLIVYSHDRLSRDAHESNIIGGRTFLGNQGNILNNVWAGGPPYK